MLKPLALSLAVMMPTPANAQLQCADSKGIVKELADQYGETAMYAMQSGDGRIIILLANTDTGTWTQLVSSEDDMLCVVGYGTDFKAVPQGEEV